MRGYLVPITPHIYRHIPEHYHPHLLAIVGTGSLLTVAERLHVHPHTLDYAITRILDEMGLERSDKSWRVALTRLYYGIDKCWCQKVVA